MAKDLLDPTAQDDTSDNINPERNAGQQDYNDKFNTITNTPENQAFGDQANASAQDGFKYSPDPDRQDLAEQEQGGGNAVSNAESDESSRLGGPDEPDGESSPTSKSRFKGLLGNKKVQGGLLGGGIIGVLIGGFMGAQPFQIIHLAKTLSQLSLSRNERTQDMSLRRTYNVLTGEGQRNNLSATASALARRQTGRLEAKGFEFHYDREDGGRNRRTLQRITVPDTPEGNRILSQVNASMVDGRTINTKGLSGMRDTRAIARELNKIDGKRGISGYLSYRRQIRMFGATFRPMNVLRRSGQSLSDYIRGRRDTKSEEFKSSSAEKGRVGQGVDIDADGNTNSTGRGEASDLGGEVDSINNEPDASARKARIKALKVGGGAAALVGVLCAAREVGDNVEEYKVMNTMMPLINMTWDIIATGSQIMSGQDVTADEVAAVAEVLYDEENKEAWNAAAPIVQGVGGEGGIEIDSSVKDQISDSFTGDKPVFFEQLDNIWGLGALCTAEGWFNSLPGVSHFNDAMGWGANKLSSAVTGKSVDEYMQDLVAVIAGDAIDTLAEGASFGNLVSYGGRLISNTSAIAMGGSKLSASASLEWKQYEKEVRLAEQKEKSVFARYFDLNDTESIASTALMSSPSLVTPRAFADSLQKQPIAILSSPAKFVASTVSNSHAQSVDVNNYSYGIDEYGIPLSVLESERYADMYSNIDRVESDLDSYIDDFGHCFGNVIDGNGRITDKSIEDDTSIYKRIADSSECTSSDQRFRDFQVYVLDNVSVKSMACYEGIDESACSEIGFGGATPSGNQPTPGQTGPLPEGEVSEADTVHVPSCGGSGWSVHRSIEQNVDAMCRQAASDGTPLTIGNSWRSSARQIELRKSNCGGTSHYVIYQMPSSACRPPTAPPGRSNHQRGLAIDFASCSTRSTACYRWLAANAERFGFYNLPSEPWHWSVDGG